MSLELLLNLGFVHSGTCSDDNEVLRIEVHANANANNILYAFVENEDVRYIGYTENTFINRLYGYSRPGVSQTTNLRINAKARYLLQVGRQLDIYCFNVQNLLQYRGVNLNLAAGLEMALISQVAQYNSQNNILPLWNMRGNPYFNQGMPVPPAEEAEELIEENLNYLPTEQVIVEQFEPVDVSVVLNPAYYNNPFFNLGIAATGLLGAGGEYIAVDLLGINPGVINDRVINRTANGNGSPRLHLGNQYTQWVQANFNPGDSMNVRIINQNHIQLSNLN